MNIKSSIKTRENRNYSISRKKNHADITFSSLGPTFLLNLIFNNLHPKEL